MEVHFKPYPGKVTQMIIRAEKNVREEKKKKEGFFIRWHEIFNVYFLFLRQIYVHDCTMVSPYPLLFFGGSISILTVITALPLVLTDFSVAQLVCNARVEN